MIEIACDNYRWCDRCGPSVRAVDVVSIGDESSTSVAIAFASSGSPDGRLAVRHKNWNAPARYERPLSRIPRVQRPKSRSTTVTRSSPSTSAGPSEGGRMPSSREHQPVMRPAWRAP